MSMPFITRVRTDLDGALPTVRDVNGIMMTGDNAANQIVVELYRNGSKVSVPSSSKIVGYFIRPDWYTVEYDGYINGNGEAVVNIPAAAYRKSGPLSIAVRMMDDRTETPDPDHPGQTIIEYGSKIVIAALRCQIHTTATTAIIDPEHKIPDVQELLAYIDDLRQMQADIGEAEQGRVAAEEGRVEAESGRVSAEQGRVQAESNRSTAELARTRNESARKIAEGLRAQEESDRETAEGLRAQAESTRVRNENTRSTAESTRQSNESTRQSREAARQSNESTRQTHEQARVQAEFDRVITESGRVTAESNRATAESNRDSAERARAQAESNRVTAEQARVTAENGRSTAESTRQSNESTRQSNESTRQTQETTRQNNTAAAIQQITDMEVASETLPVYSEPTVRITTVNGHKKITFGQAPGDPFVIAKTFPSIADMNAYTGTDIREGAFVLISSNVEDPDNARMYVCTGYRTYSFVTDLSGSQGIQGPQGIRGETGNGISSATMSNYQLTLNYTDGTHYTTPSIRGEKGEKGDKGDKGDKGEDATGSIVFNYQETGKILTVDFN